MPIPNMLDKEKSIGKNGGKIARLKNQVSQKNISRLGVYAAYRKIAFIWLTYLGIT
jgi:hypothetical protein